jgi:hypothetical protein
VVGAERFTAAISGLFPESALQLAENSILLLLLGGAALQRCGKCVVLNPALAAEGTGPAQKRLFPQPGGDAAALSSPNPNNFPGKSMYWLGK